MNNLKMNLKLSLFNSNDRKVKGKKNRSQHFRILLNDVTKGKRFINSIERKVF